MFQPTTFGKYFLTRRIAVGGMAEVFHAKLYGADGFEKDLVIKQILPQHAREPEFVQSFVAEAKIAVTLNHANIVGIYELGRVDRTYFIAMEYIDGLDAFMLNQVALRYGERLGIGHALLVVEEVARGLDYAHRKQAPDGSPLGLVHRDLNPRNVLISREGEVKILDFGIAKTEGTIAAMPKTRAGVVKGTTGYMSPEQAMGREIDAKTDIYQAGLLLFELLTGQAMFWRPDDLETRDLMRKHRILTPSTLVADVAPELDQLVFEALARDPNQRIETAATFAARIAQYRLAHFPEISHRSLGELVVRLMDREQRDEAAADRVPPTDQLFDTGAMTSTGEDAAPLIVTIAERELPPSPPPTGRNLGGHDQTFGNNASNRAAPPNQPSLASEALALNLVPGSTLADALEPAPERPPQRRLLLAGALLVGLSAVVGAAAIVQRSRLDDPQAIVDPHTMADTHTAVDTVGRPASANAANAANTANAANAANAAELTTRGAPSEVVNPPRTPDRIPSPDEEAIAQQERTASVPSSTPGHRRTTMLRSTDRASQNASQNAAKNGPTSPANHASSAASAAVSFGTKGCSGRVFLDGVLVARTLPTFNIEATVGSHVVKFEGTDCPRRERPDSLGSSIPVVIRRIHLRPGEHLKLIADFEHGTAVVP